MPHILHTVWLDSHEPTNKDTLWIKPLKKDYYGIFVYGSNGWVLTTAMFKGTIGEFVIDQLPEATIETNGVMAAQDKRDLEMLKEVLANIDVIIETINNIDQTPTEGSQHMVTSGGVHESLKGKVDVVDGKGLSTEDFTSEEKNKLASIPDDIINGIQSDWNTNNNDSVSYIKNRTHWEENGVVHKLHPKFLDMDASPTSGSTKPVTSGGAKEALDGKQDALVSGTNIKTINGESLLGSGDIEVAAESIDTVEVSVDSNTGTPSATASVSGSTLNLVFHNIKGETGATGPQGPKGDKGDPGSDASVTATNIESALGYTPADEDDLATKEDVSNKVTTVTSSGTDTQYPSAKAVFDAIEGKKDPTVIAESGAEIVYRQTHGGVATGFSGAVVKGLKGRTLAWNQLIRDGDFSGTFGVYWNCWNAEYISASVGNNKCTVTVLIAGSYEDNSSIVQSLPSIQGHKYYIAANFESSVSGLYPIYEYNGAGTSHFSDKGRNSAIFQVQATPGSLLMKCGGDKQVGDSWSYSDIICVDLTLMFGAGNEPSTVAEFEALFPLPYYGYNEGELISVAAEGIETVGFNLFDEGIMSGWDGITRNADGWSGALNKFWSHWCFENTFNYTGRVFFNVNYSLDGGTGFLSAIYVDGTYNDFRLDPATRATVGYETPEEKVIEHIEFSYVGSGTLTIHSLCINLSDASRNGTYEPHWSKVLPLGLDAFKVKDSQGNIITVNGLASAGNVRDEIRGAKYIKRVGRLDLGTLTWTKGNTQTYDSDLSNFYTTNFAVNVKSGGDLICGKYADDTSGELARESRSPYSISMDRNEYLVVVDSGTYTGETLKTALSGVYLYYVLKTPVEYDLASPMPSLYAVDDLGTEAKYPADTATSVTAPITADIQYGIKARDIAAEAEDIFTAIRNMQS